MTDERQIAVLPANQVTTKRGFPVYRTNPSIPSTNGIPTRSRRFQVPGGKAAMIVDNSTGEIKGIGGMGFWWEEEVDTTRFVKLFRVLSARLQYYFGRPAAGAGGHWTAEFS